jgi:hypothetical protein
MNGRAVYCHLGGPLRSREEDSGKEKIDGLVLTANLTFTTAFSAFGSVKAFTHSWF